mmetsp:Transcript_18996/g.32449  ORF Transcript_18996/g.32449 Transcript_18996/m.32449 type:complete len:182 (+) Transcript_18996:98-643(+)|eukprot:CAMPEP_0168626102 /NCGR_PEP_ID=MMETSP0449_2-20121227/10428_1 /TAXON_ID=1082188 /ORGANISM="Strombidium rassoulzadegani, Strain ras09" /LENGTH=181 /DNA_ID=CAMNT_0008668025 /DNA_START=212 /DNA_END=757 /DNA_ORIENTATION=+
MIGCITVPITGVLRAGQSVSQGISGSANQLGNSGKIDPKMCRVRPPRRIGARGQLKVYQVEVEVIGDSQVEKIVVLRKNQRKLYSSMDFSKNSGARRQSTVVQSKRNAGWFSFKRNKELNVIQEEDYKDNKDEDHFAVGEDKYDLNNLNQLPVHRDRSGQVIEESRGEGGLKNIYASNQTY